MRRIGLLPRLAIAIVAGILIGLISRSTGNFVIVRLLATLNDIFGNFLKYIVPLIILGFVTPGIAELGKGATKLLVATAALAYISTIIAGTASFSIASVILPGLGIGGDVISPGAGQQAPFFSIGIPPLMDVMSALITAFMLGLGMAYLNEKRLYGVLKDFQDIIIGVIRVIIIPLLPWHIAGIFANLTSAGQIFQILITFGKLYALIFSLQIAYIIAQYLIAYFYTGKNPVQAIRNMLPAYFTALGTQSSAATIPVTLESTRRNGVSEDVVDFVIPLDATIHLAGDTITLTVASMAVLLLTGRVPTVGLMLPFIFLLGVTMVAAPGIPGGGVIAALGLLQGMLGFGTPESSLMIALHFAQDSFGTATNVTGDGAMAIIIDKLARGTKRVREAPEPAHD